MSVVEINAAEACGVFECPLSDNFTLPEFCQIPYDGTADDYCVSSKVFNIAKIMLILAVLFYMVGVGAAMEVEKAKHALKHPKPPLVGLFCQVVLNPLWMFALIAIFGSDFPVATRIMAILIASAPGGSGSNFLTLLAYGSVELSVAMTIFSTFMSFGTMPLYVYIGTEVIWKEESADLKVDFISITLAAATATFLPLLGLLIKLKAPKRFSEFVAYWGTLIGVILTVGTAFLYLADPLFRVGLRSLGPSIWACSVLLNAGGLCIGYSASRLAGFPRRFHRTIAFEVGSQNIAIALAIVTVSFSNAAGPVSTLFTPFIGAYLIGSVPTNYGWMLILRYGYPIHEPHHDGYDEEEEAQLDKEFGAKKSKETTGASIVGTSVDIESRRSNSQEL